MGDMADEFDRLVAEGRIVLPPGWIAMPAEQYAEKLAEAKVGGGQDALAAYYRNRASIAGQASADKRRITPEIRVSFEDAQPRIYEYLESFGSTADRKEFPTRRDIDRKFSHRYEAQTITDVLVHGLLNYEVYKYRAEGVRRAGTAEAPGQVRSVKDPERWRLMTRKDRDHVRELFDANPRKRDEAERLGFAVSVLEQESRADDSPADSTQGLSL